MMELKRAWKLGGKRHIARRQMFDKPSAERASAKDFR